MSAAGEIYLYSVDQMLSFGGAAIDSESDCGLVEA